MENKNINTNATDTQMNSTNESKSESFANEALTANTNYGTISSADIENGTAELVLVPPFEGDDGGISVMCVEGDDSSCNKASQTDMDNATLLTLNQWKCDSITDTVSERWYRFNTEDETEPKMKVYYTIYTTGNTNTTGRLYDYQGNFVAMNDDRSGSLNFRIVHMLAASGTYYVKVTAPSSEMGNFEIRVIKRVLPTISKYNTTLDIGGTDSISVTMLPNSTSNFCVEYLSSNPDIATVDSHTGNVIAVDTGITVITARDKINNDIIGECEVWVRGKKRPVFLLHGRMDNSSSLWGVTNDTCNYNNHYDSHIDATTTNTNKTSRYTDVSSQSIIDIHNETADGVVNDPEDTTKVGNLAKFLEDQGYERNLNVFAFNYPNRDAVVHNARKFKKYIDNLISYIRTSGSDKIKVFFYENKENYNNNNYKFNIIAHSMGGLVARYYIENMGHDHRVDKLITISTPHWGTYLANIGCNVGNIFVDHSVCDHDLCDDARIFGGNNSTNLSCDALFGGCPNEYQITDELQYTTERSTRYYAFAGVSNPELFMNDDSVIIEDLQEYSTYNALEEGLKDQHINFSIYNESDNVVGFLSQIGWKNDHSNEDFDENSIPSKYICFEKIYLVMDTNRGNSWLSLLHNKIPHRRAVMEHIIDVLRS